MKRTRLLASAAALAILSTAASAATIDIVKYSAQNGPANEADSFAGSYGAFTPATATWIGGSAPVFTGSTNQNKSPWVDTGLEATQSYFSVGGNNSISPRVIDLGVNAALNSLRLLWGSIDSYNSLSFSADNSTYHTTITGGQVASAIDDNATCDPAKTNVECVAVVDLKDISEFRYVKFSSENANGQDRAAFEFAVLEGFSSTVEPIPVPAGVWLLGSALAGLGIARRRRKKS